MIHDDGNWGRDPISDSLGLEILGIHLDLIGLELGFWHQGISIANKRGFGLSC